MLSLNAQTIDSLEVTRKVDSLIKISRDLTAKRIFDKAIEINGEAEKLVFENLNQYNSLYANCCFNKGRILFFKGDYKESENWYLKSLSMREKILGRNHPDFAWSLNNLGLLYNRTGQYNKALEFLMESRAIREKVYGNEHPDYLASQTNIANVYLALNNFEMAEAIYLEIKEIRDKISSTENIEYAGNLINLGIVYGNQSNYDKSIEFLQLAKRLFESKLKNLDHPFYINCLNNLGLTLKEAGQFEKAEPLLLQSNEIWMNTVGKQHPNYANSLTNLANLYSQLGQFKKAEQFLLESMEIRKKILGTEHTDYAQTLNNLASFYFKFKEFDKALNLFNDAKLIYSNSIGQQSQLYATVLFNIGNVYLAMQDFKNAYSNCMTARSIYEKSFGKENLEYAQCQQKLGEIEYNQHHFKAAIDFTLDAKNIIVKNQGTKHPLYLEVISQLADIHISSGENSNAVKYLIESSDLFHSQIINAVYFLSESEMAQYLETFKKYQFRLLAYVHQNPESEEILNLCMNNALFYKGFLLDAYNQFKRLALKDQHILDKYSLLKSFGRRLAVEYTKPINEQEQVEFLQAKYNELEKEILKGISGLASLRKQVDWQELQQKLHAGEAAIEFVNYYLNDEDSIISSKYGALVLKPEMSHPEFVFLCNGNDLSLLESLQLNRRLDYVNELYSKTDRGANAVEHKNKSLYELLWSKMERTLAGVNTIYFSPIGLLHRINLNAIPISEEETLADRFNFIEQISTRQLVFPYQQEITSSDAVLYGGIRFDVDTSLNSKEPFLTSITSRSHFVNSVDSSLRGGAWNYLPGTDKEVNVIGNFISNAGLKTKLFKGFFATEESFKEIGIGNTQSPRILHLATHGYFFSDPERTSSTVNGIAQDRTKNQETSKVDSSKTNGSLIVSEPVFKISDHPMLRSGLILAGGNEGWNGKQLLEGKEDGVLTAFEISQMNLSNTELVVLSACETGLGDIQGNEGVYGLQRAFKIAGAKYLIMSLWQVPDKQTSLLMTTFYKKWLENKMSIPNAFHAAQKELRDIGLDPYQWAGFVLVE